MKTKVIIPAAGLGTRILPISKEKPKTLVPINGRPALHYIISEIDSIIKEEYDLEIIIGHKGEQIIEFCKNFYPKREIKFTTQHDLKGLAHAISLAEAEKDQPTLVWLGDTLIKSDRELVGISRSLSKESFILCERKKDPTRWCWAEQDENSKVEGFLEKSNGGSPTTRALVGVYYFLNGGAIVNICKNICKDDSNKVNGEFQLSTAMKEYIDNNDPMFMAEVDGKSLKHYDIGSIDLYQKTRKAFLDKRVAHSFKDISPNIILKSSSSNTIMHQAAWLKNVPMELQPYNPAVYEVDYNNNSYTMEYFNLPTLQELFIWHDLSESAWDNILGACVKYLEDGNPLTRSVTDGRPIKEKFYSFILNKTKERTEGNPFFDDIRDVIDHPFWETKIKERFNEIKSVGIMHGDFCFSNILYDLGTGMLKVIDPRGYWGDGATMNVTILGDSLYDLAKLMHSAYYDYDLIKNEITERNESQKAVKEMFISGLPENYVTILMAICFHLFVSMIPLHSDKPHQQKRMKDEAMKAWGDVCERLI